MKHEVGLYSTSTYKWLSTSSIFIINLHKAGRVEEYDGEDNPFIQHVYFLNPKPEDSYTSREEVKKHPQAKETQLTLLVFDL